MGQFKYDHTGKKTWVEMPSTPPPNPTAPCVSRCGPVDMSLFSHLQSHSQYDSYMKWVSFADPTHRQKASDIVVEFYEHMSNYITLFPLFGTLLGIVREKSLIPHDFDVDFGYFTKEQNQMVEGLHSLHGQNGFILCRVDRAFDLLSIAKDDVIFDLYGYTKSAHLYLQGSRKGYALLTSEVEPMNTVEFNGHTMSSIGNPQAFIERHYGPSWETPVHLLPPEEFRDA
jgi:hypothetical protein